MKRGRLLALWTLVAPLCMACALGAAAATSPAGGGTGSTVPPANPPAFEEKLATPALLAQLRNGGLVLYMRHALTDNGRADRVPEVDLRDCNTQRVLSEAGRQQATRLGATLRRARIPVDEVFHSPMCRARETAQRMFPGQVLHEEPALLYTSNLTTVAKQPVVARTRALLSTAVPPGHNRVVVAHAPNLADLMGYFIRPEGTVAVFRPLGDGRFEYLASIPPDLWPSLLP